MLVAEGFYLINAIEKYGSGFIRIRKALKEYPEIDFEIKEFTGGVTVTFAQKPPALSLGGLNGGVNPELNQLLELTHSSSGLRVTELVSQRGKPARMIERWLKQLKDNQRIEFRGAPKTGGYFLRTLGQINDEQ